LLTIALPATRPWLGFADNVDVAIVGVTNNGGELFRSYLCKHTLSKLRKTIICGF